MRSALPLISLLIALSAAAQEVTLATPAERTWIYLTIITSFDWDEYTESMRSQGFSEGGMQALRNYVSDGTEELHALAERDAEELCSRRAEFEADAQKLARMFERQSAEKEALRQRHVDRLGEALDAGDEATLHWMMEHDVFVKMHGGLEGIHFDLPAAIRSGSMTPTEIADRSCKTLNPR